MFFLSGLAHPFFLFGRERFEGGVLERFWGGIFREMAMTFAGKIRKKTWKCAENCSEHLRSPKKDFPFGGAA